MGFEFEYKLNGRKVTQKQWMDGLADQAIKESLPQIEKDVHREVAALRCPTHHETPQIRTSIVGHELRSQITACCEPMREQAQMIATRQT